jgi:hypothetical protein
LVTSLGQGRECNDRESWKVFTFQGAGCFRAA